MKDIFVDFNVKFGLEKVWKWKWWVFGAGVLAGIVSIVWSLQLPDEYKSTASFIPPDISSLNSMVFTSGFGYKGFEAAPAGDIDRTVAYLTSTQVTDSIAKKFNLYEHYGIDTGHHKADEWFYNAFGNKNKVSYSDWSVLQIECYDENSYMARDIANTYLEMASDWFEEISQRKLGLVATQNACDSLRARQALILDSLEYLRTEHNLYHVDHVGAELDRLLAKEIATNPEFGRYYDEMIAYELELNSLDDEIIDFERELLQRKINLRQYPSLIQITSRGTVSTFKARPKRSIIVIISVLATLVFASFVVIMLDRTKDRLPI